MKLHHFSEFVYLCTSKTSSPKSLVLLIKAFQVIPSRTTSGSMLFSVYRVNTLQWSFLFPRISGTSLFIYAGHLLGLRDTKKGINVGVTKLSVHLNMGHTSEMVLVLTTQPSKMNMKQLKIHIQHLTQRLVMMNAVTINQNEVTRSFRRDHMSSRLSHQTYYSLPR